MPDETMTRLIRIGNVSAIDPTNGMVSVTYPQLDDDTTPFMPWFSLNDEYKMPLVGDRVIVLHLPDGQSSGVVLGHYWNMKNTAPKTGERIYHKEFMQSDRWGEAYESYDGDSRTLTIHVPNLCIEVDGEITVTANNITSTAETNITQSAGVTNTVSGGANVTVSAPSFTINAGSTTNSGPYTSPADVIAVSAVSLASHVHADGTPPA